MNTQTVFKRAIFELFDNYKVNYCEAVEVLTKVAEEFEEQVEEEKTESIADKIVDVLKDAELSVDESLELLDDITGLIAEKGEETQGVMDAFESSNIAETIGEGGTTTSSPVSGLTETAPSELGGPRTDLGQDAKLPEVGERPSVDIEKKHVPVETDTEFTPTPPRGYEENPEWGKPGK